MTHTKSIRKLLACIMAVMIALAYMPAAYADDEGGEGAEGTTITIETAEDLAQLATDVSEGLVTEDVTVQLAADIDLSSICGPEIPVAAPEEPPIEPDGEGDEGDDPPVDPPQTEEVSWTPIGTSENPFAGVFDGAGYAITGLYINADADNQALFGFVSGATICNLSVAGTVKANANGAGVIANAAAGTTIENVGNCAAVTTVDGNGGGIVGSVSGTGVVIQKSFNKGDVEAYDYAGGIVGINTGAAGALTVRSSYNNGSATATSKPEPTNQTRNVYTYAGGICASPCTVENCYSTGTIYAIHGNKPYIGNITYEDYGYAITPGSTAIANNAYTYWLAGSAAAGSGNNTNRIASRSAAQFTNGTVFGQLNTGAYAGTWIEGYKVKAEQDYPGLAWEIKPVDELIEIALAEFESYAENFDPEDYRDVQKEELADAIAAGIAAIQAAEDDAAIDAALADAKASLDAIPTDAEMAEYAANVIDQLFRYKNLNQYDQIQRDEITAIIEEATEAIYAATSYEAMDEILAEAKAAIDEIPNSTQAAAAAAAKESLKDTIILGNTTLASGGEYTKDSVAELRDALNAAKNVYNDVNAFEADVKAVQEWLYEALLGLEAGNDTAKAALLETLIDVQGIASSAYTAASYAALQEAIDAANEVLLIENEPAELLKEARVNILKAQKALVKKAKNTMTVTVKKKTVKVKKVKAKKQVVKAITVKKAVGKVTYKKTSGAAKLTVNAKNGKITVKKGTKKGTYKAKVKVTAAGNGDFKAGNKTVQVVIVVK